MSQKVVLLLSDKRSGSTMFQRELCRHPDIQTVAYSPHTYLETHHWLKAAVMLSSDPAGFSGGKIYAGYGGNANARTYMEDCIKGNIPSFNTRIPDRSLVFEGWEALCRRFAQPIFFEKSPQYLAHWAALSLMLEWIKKTDFEVKIVGLVRNPLSVLYSAEELFHSNPRKRQFGWAEIYRNWVRLTQSLDANQFILCKYEDVINDPKAEFGKICAFIGTPYNDVVGKNVRDTSLAKWKTDPYFSIQLNPSVKEVAIQLGYSPDELVNPCKARPALNRHFKRVVVGRIRLLIARFKDRVWRPFVLRRGMKTK